MKKLLSFLLSVILLPACTIMNRKPAASSPNPSVTYLAHVQDYLVKHIVQANFGGRVFCAYDVLGADMLSDRADVYVWALCAEYYREGEILTMGTASSLPVAMHMQISSGGYQMVSSEVPEDGIGYGASLQRIFPEAAIERMCHDNADCYNERANRLEGATKQQAEEFYSAP